jgi:hypothetical protein
MRLSYLQRPGSFPDPGGGGEDTARAKEPKGFGEGGQTTPPLPDNGAGFSFPTGASRADSAAWFQKDKLFGLDTVPDMRPPTPTGPPVVEKPGVKPRRGIVGLHPLALLAGLVAFHIFIASVAGK